jgi:CheY-like chemotaxis protein/anti-sigma regulatory factor (Ser/Thr protein kinase)
MIEPQARQHGITMSFCRFERPCFVLADRTRVKQILVNLLSNAIKYNQAGGSVITDYQIISAERLRITVTDTGPGLSPEQLAQLFQPFNRLGRESGGEEGTGIGLVMTKRLVELMDGVIGVTSVVGKGSTFWVELVRTEEPRLAESEARHKRPAPTPAAGLASRALLYVEDNPANLKLVEQLVARRPNLRMLSAGNATVGIGLARDHLPDVILMDINLPGISGIKALGLLRNDPLTRHIPVVAISANAMPHDIRRGLEAGFFRYLTKPLKVDAFMEALDLALDRSTPQ